MPRNPPPELGVYHDVPADEYHAWEAVNSSRLRFASARDEQRRLVFSQRIYDEYHTRPDKDPTPQQRLGTICHAALLEPRVFRTAYTVMPDFAAELADKYKSPRASKEYKDRVAEWQAAHTDKQVLTIEEWNAAMEMLTAIPEQLEDPSILVGKTEISIVWDDPVTDLRCKARIDKVTADGKWLVDLKTSANVMKFTNSIFDYGYYQQMAFYTDGWRHATGEDRRPVMLAVDPKSPYSVRCAPLDDKWMQLGRDEYKSLLRQIAANEREGLAPGWPSPETWAPANWMLPHDEPVIFYVNGHPVEV